MSAAPLCCLDAAVCTCTVKFSPGQATCECLTELREVETVCAMNPC